MLYLFFISTRNKVFLIHLPHMFSHIICPINLPCVGRYTLLETTAPSIYAVSNPNRTSSNLLICFTPFSYMQFRHFLITTSQPFASYSNPQVYNIKHMPFGYNDCLTCLNTPRFLDYFCSHVQQFNSICIWQP